LGQLDDWEGPLEHTRSSGHNFERGFSFLFFFKPGKLKTPSPLSERVTQCECKIQIRCGVPENTRPLGLRRIPSQCKVLHGIASAGIFFCLCTENILKNLTWTSTPRDARCAGGMHTKAHSIAVRLVYGSHLQKK
jgi:hypothetical protein